MNKKLFLSLVKAGKTNKQIAKISNCCEQTVAATKKRFGIPDLEARKRAGRKPKIS